MAISDGESNDDVDADADLDREIHGTYVNLANLGWSMCQGHYIILVQRSRMGDIYWQQASDLPEG